MIISVTNVFADDGPKDRKESRAKHNVFKIERSSSLVHNR